MYLERYKPVKRIGRGAYGDVYLVEDTKNGARYALKLYSLEMIQK
jgi:serine/threonine protein kinase